MYEKYKKTNFFYRRKTFQDMPRCNLKYCTEWNPVKYEREIRKL